MPFRRLVVYTDLGYAVDGKPTFDIEREILGDLAEIVLASPNDLLAGMHGAHVAVIGRRRCDRAMADALAPTCSTVIKLGTGTDNIEVTYLRELGIDVWNIADYATPEVTAQAVALVLALERHVVSQHRAVSTGTWDPCHPAIPRRLSERRVGLVGFGRIGQAIGRVLVALYADVGFYDPKPQGVASGYESFTHHRQLSALFESADVVVIACELNDSSEGLINHEALQGARRKPFLVNVSRGRVVSQAAVADALDAGLLAGYGADVFDPEPPRRALDPVFERLVGRDDVIFSAHRGFLSDTSRAVLRRRAAELARHALMPGAESAGVHHT